MARPDDITKRDEEPGPEAVARLETRLANLPRNPGVYLMKDRTGRIIYVGKAQRLDHRVRSYFSGTPTHPKQAALVRRVVDIDVIVTDSDMEALILEMTLIKEKRPVYNINLKDDKRFPFVKVTLQEPWPRILLTRRVKGDGARYFGPYTDVRALRQTLRNLRVVFPLRSCGGARPGRGPQLRDCLDYHIHRCLGPCILPGTEAEYRRIAEEFCLFLSGQADRVVDRIRSQMEEHSERLEFEAASRLRDRIQLIERTLRRQKMVDVHHREADVLAVSRTGDLAVGVVLQIRGNSVLGKERRTLRGVADRSDAEVMAAFILHYYGGAETIPPRVVAASDIDDEPLIEAWLNDRARGRVEVHTARRGSLAGLARLATQNARMHAEELGGGRARRIEPAVYELQKALGLKTPPVRIDGFDISNIQGAHPVASLVVQINGAPARAEYRRYRMRSPGPNDFAMMKEVVGRRARRIRDGEFPRPDLILIDGGRGQVGAALEALTEAGLPDIPLVGLAKREEELILPDRPDSLRLPRQAPALKLLIQLRDEAHRFALTYHRKLRGSAALSSELDRLHGIGAERRLALLHHFGSLEKVVAASEIELARVPGFGPSLARRLFADLHVAPAETGSGVAGGEA